MTVSSRPYAGLSPDQRDADRRRRILDALREIIGTDGYTATTVGRVCSTAGVSTRHFYQLYDTKESAFIDLYREITRASYDGALQSLAATEGKPIADRVPEAFLAYLGPMVEDLRTARIAFVEIMGVSPRFEHERLQIREGLVALVETEGGAAVARGEIADQDFRIAAQALAGGASSVVYDWAVRDDRPSVAHLEQALARLAIKLIAG